MTAILSETIKTKPSARRDEETAARLAVMSAGATEGWSVANREAALERVKSMGLPQPARRILALDAAREPDRARGPHGLDLRPVGNADLRRVGPGEGRLHRRCLLRRGK